MEDARNQLAVLQVVCRQRRFIVMKAAVDFIHPIRGLSMALPSPSSSRATDSVAKEEKFQNADFSASMPSIISRPLA